MDTGLAIEFGLANRGKEPMVFDWDKAAMLIRERKPEIAEAGLKDDWEWTGGVIYENGEPVLDSYTFLSSTWAKPLLYIDDDVIECYVMKSETVWGSDTKWPDSALNILRGGSSTEITW